MVEQVKRFVHVSVKSTFIQSHSDWTTKYVNSIIFFKDTQEIWTHGTFYAIPESFQGRISDAESAIQALQQATGNYKWFSKVSDGATTLSASAKDSTVVIKGAGNASISLSEAGFQVSVGDIAEGTANGTVKNLAGQDVAVHGLKSAAYTEASAYATSAQGAKADSAVQDVVDNAEYIVATKNSSNKIEISDEALKTKIGALETAIGNAASAGVTQIINNGNWIDTDKQVGVVTFSDTKLDTEFANVRDEISAAEGRAKSHAETEAGKVNTALNNYKAEVAKDYATKTELGTTNTNLSNLQGRVEAFLDNAGVATEAIDTLKEIQDYIASDKTGGAELVAKVGNLEEHAVTDIAMGTTSSLVGVELNKEANDEGDAGVGQLFTINVDTAALEQRLEQLQEGIDNAEAAGVTSFGGQTGVITLNTATTEKNVKLEMSGKQLKGTVQGVVSNSEFKKTVGLDANSVMPQEDYNYLQSDVTLFQGLKDLDAALKAEETSRINGDANTLASAKSYADDMFAWEEL